jgi:hypothetical protein
VNAWKTPAVFRLNSTEREKGEPIMRFTFGNTSSVLAPRSSQKPINKQRRTFIGGAAAALLASSLPMRADLESTPNDPFILLLHGIYQPVPAGGGPADNLGLTTVNLSDGSYSKTRIYPIFGVDGTNDQKKSIGTFYVQFNGYLCAYDLPGGSIAMTFLDPPPGAPDGFNAFVPFPDGAGGYYQEGTFELNITEATGIYAAFRGGHNHMVDRLHQLADGNFNEFCFCNISQYAFP